jgi:hypothetical protein
MKILNEYLSLLFLLYFSVKCDYFIVINLCSVVALLWCLFVECIYNQMRVYKTHENSYVLYPIKSYQNRYFFDPSYDNPYYVSYEVKSQAHEFVV